MAKHKSEYKEGFIKWVHDPFEGATLTKEQKRAALDEIVDLVESEFFSKLESGSSPVAGERWKKSLSKEYKKRKQKLGQSSISDMEFKNNMLPKIKIRATADDQLSISIRGNQAKKLDGHSKLVEGNPILPRRRSIPGEGQKLKTDIMSEIRKIVIDKANE